MNTDNEQTFINASREALDKEAEQLSPELRQQLAQSRQQALSKTNASKKTDQGIFNFWPGLYPIGAALATVLLVVLWLPGTQHNGSLHNNGTDQISENGVDILSTEEELELYEELDFIIWLADQPVDA